MKNMKRILKITLQHWNYLTSGLFFMVGFAIFSGASITLAIPLMDNVFKKTTDQIIYTNLSTFGNAIVKTISAFTSQYGSLLKISSKDTLQPLLDNLSLILEKTDSHLLLWIIGGSLLSITLLKNFFFYGQRILFANLQGHTIKDIRNLIYRKYLYQSLAFFNKNKVGDSLVRMVADVNIIGNFLVTAIFESLKNIILIFVFARIALFINAKLFLISFILFPIFSLILYFLGNKIKKYSKRIQQQSSNMFSNVEEKLNNMRIVKAFSREKFEMNKFREINKLHFKYWRKSVAYNAFNIPLSETIGVTTGVIILIIGGNQVLNPNINFSFGSFIAFMLAIFSIQHPMKVLTKIYANIKKANVSLDRISEIIDRTSEIIEIENPLKKHTFEKKIEFKNVDFSYGESVKILDNINFTINKGEKIAIVGNSGSGKTTLINLLTRMYDVDSGEILIDNENVKNFKLQNLRTLMGTVTQDSVLFSETIAANIRYGSLSKISDHDIKKVAKIAYADEFIEKLPKKYKTQLSVKGSNFSGGQKQRLCIARAIVGNPPILIFDEATSALDSEAEHKVQKAIEQATKNRTVIVIAHRLSTILSSDKIVVMDGGKISEIGKHNELLKTCEKYKKLHEMQFKEK